MSWARCNPIMICGQAIKIAKGNTTKLAFGFGCFAVSARATATNSHNMPSATYSTAYSVRLTRPNGENIFGTTPPALCRSLLGGASKHQVIEPSFGAKVHHLLR